MRFLMERRLDPPWRNAFYDQLGEVRGHDLLKCTIIDEYLMESDLLPKVLRETLDVDWNSVADTTAALAKAIGRPLPRFEDDVRAWMIHGEKPGLVQRLAAGMAADTGDADRRGPPVPYLS